MKCDDLVNEPCGLLPIVLMRSVETPSVRLENKFGEAPRERRVRRRDQVCKRDRLRATAVGGVRGVIVRQQAQDHVSVEMFLDVAHIAKRRNDGASSSSHSSLTIRALAGDERVA